MVLHLLSGRPFHLRYRRFYAGYRKISHRIDLSLVDDGFVLFTHRLVPLVNLIVMVVLAIPPSGLFRRTAAQIEAERKHSEQLAQAFAPPTTVETALPLDYQGHSRAGAVALAVGLGCFTQIAIGTLPVPFVRDGADHDERQSTTAATHH